MGQPSSRKVLICPMDWGLGHATRCVPVIRALLALNQTVLIASSGDALAFLKSEFPSLSFFALKGYAPVYSRSGAFLSKMFLQLPGFAKTIRAEHAETIQIAEQHAVDLIISDNRYGCYSAAIPSIIITHQLSIRASLFSGMVNFMLRKKIRHFSACWVPDLPGSGSLAGHLAISRHIKAKYIGPLSRFKNINAAIRYDLLAIISGPEPQRTIFEELIRASFGATRLRTLMIKGSPALRADVMQRDTAEVPHLSSEEMNAVIASSAIVICRSGYSSIMDLAVLGKKAIFIPTPGQTEQEFLASRLAKRKIAFTVAQDKFDLTTALEQSKNYDGFTPLASTDLLHEALNSILR